MMGIKRWKCSRGEEVVTNKKGLFLDLGLEWKVSLEAGVSQIKGAAEKQAGEPASQCKSLQMKRGKHMAPSSFSLGCFPASRRGKGIKANTDFLCHALFKETLFQIISFKSCVHESPHC